MVQMARPHHAEYSSAHQPTTGVGGFFATIKVLALLALWAAAFIAFLMAPLIVLGAAWIIGLAILALRQRGHGSRATGGAARAPQPHRFGAARTPDSPGGAQ